MTAAPARPRPLVTVRPTGGWAAVGLRELWQFRDLLVILSGRDIKVRYKQTALGVSWVLIQPLFSAGLLTFVFNMIAGLRAPANQSYFLFAFTGMIAWNAFGRTLQNSSESMSTSTHLVQKVYFPRLLLPLSRTLSALVDVAVPMALMFALLVREGWRPQGELLLLPAVLLLLIALGLGIGMPMAALWVSYRDVHHILPVAVQLLFFATPVAYPLERVEQSLSGVLLDLYRLNPVVSLVQAFRYSVGSAETLALGWLAYAAVVSVIAFAVGAVLFKRMERRFADVI